MLKPLAVSGNFIKFEPLQWFLLVRGLHTLSKVIMKTIDFVKYMLNGLISGHIIFKIGFADP